MSRFYNKLTWGDWVMAMSFLTCFIILGWVATEAKTSHGPGFAFSPIGKEAKTFVDAAQMGYTEQPGFLRVSGQWYKVHWKFNDKRVLMQRTYEPSGAKTCMIWEFDYDKEE